MDNPTTQNSEVAPTNPVIYTVPTISPDINPIQQQNPKSRKLFVTILEIFLLSILVAACSYIYFFKLKTPTMTKKDIATQTSPIPQNQPQVKVLSISYFPTLDNITLDTTAMYNDLGYNISIDEARAKIQSLNTEIVTALENGTRYKFYKNPSAQPAIKYVIANEVGILEEVPISNTQFDDDPTTKIIDYNAILARQNICDLVENKGISEVWIWSYPGNNRGFFRSNFSSYYGDTSVSDMNPNDMPICNKSYTVYTSYYGDDATEPLKSHVLQFQALFYNLNSDLFWNKFVGFFHDEKWQGNWIGFTYQTRRCGSVTWPPNSENENDWSNIKGMLSDCEDWVPDGHGDVVNIDCYAWNCNAKDYYVYWMQNIPGKDNELIYNGSKLRNWWDFISDYDAAMKIKKDLVY
jgi:hypothetical protein